MTKKFLLLALLAFVVFLSSSQSAHAISTVGFTTTDNHDGTWKYFWTVYYDGSHGTNGYAQIEIYLPGYMAAGSNANGGQLAGNRFDGPYKITSPWNALHFNAARVGWLQSSIDLESSDQEGFDPKGVSEIAFMMDQNGHDTAAGFYNYSYILDHKLDSFFFELHDSRESDTYRILYGTAVSGVPLPPGVLLLGSGLLGLAAWRRFKKS